MKRKYKYWVVIGYVFIIVVIVASFFFPKTDKKLLPRDYEQIVQSDTLRVVTNLEPKAYYVQGDTLQGFTYELLSALQKYTPVKFSVVLENSLENSFSGLENQTYDLITRNIPVNAGLRSDFLFTKPIIRNKIVLVQRKAEFNEGKKLLRNHLQLAGKTITVPVNSPYILRLRNLSHEIGDSIFISENTTYEAQQLAMMVAAGDIEFSVCDEETARELQAKLPELDVETDIGFTHLEAWAVRSASPQLLDSLNVWIERFRHTPDFSRIYRKYYHNP
ncbi:membrane-bound lytic murein transglycosylase F [Dysgonomonas sp. PH5-45]|uniref:transporter substrate-binding domain-containing protein n=1 Tax=unclassified Dysgonomonas TaxID=2630389 RepID=UPI002476D3F2|nr:MULTISPECIES: transporter substrate-binding domain-containing protein [unclassified Dysgonomonas]MDH6354134.1 membrane-bound lytic murein transglycosylase F [Dysgonomonas sp. PH5-45]MDH6387015.1 membrane-bound lytic murein transglycosylase F [Dysgonomonas sp. PH5-37]